VEDKNWDTFLKIMNIINNKGFDTKQRLIKDTVENNDINKGKEKHQNIYDHDEQNHGQFNMQRRTMTAQTTS
jgi:hypothetical protein